jgi:chorismate synthase
MSNSSGVLFRITSFGESHGQCVGIVIDGCPAGLPLEAGDIQKEVDKRKPAPGAGQTARAEEDSVEILSGIFKGRTTGAPLSIIVRNHNIEPGVYEQIRFMPRPGHADYTSFIKYGGFNDYRGGGRFSGRVTAGLVMAGAVAKKLLNHLNIEVLAYTAQIGQVKTQKKSLDEVRLNVYRNPLRCADLTAADEMANIIRIAAEAGDSLGGLVEGLALNLPVGLGEPLFDTIEGEMAKLLFAIPAVKGVEFGAGFQASEKRGSENNDSFAIDKGKVVTETNHAGGILGGISNGMPLVVRVVVKPTPSISQKQKTVDLQKMQDTELNVQGRHDVCIVPRAVIVVESVIAITICDLALRAGILVRTIK